MGKLEKSLKDASVKEEKPKLVEMDTKTSNDMVITVKGKEDRVYRFLMPFYSPLDECYYASVNVANEIARLFNETVEKAKKEATEKAKKVSETPVSK